MPKFPPTVEQQAIIEAALSDRRSLMVTALAGCAKTSTLEFVCEALSPRPTLAVVFNVKNKKDMELRLPKFVDCKTLNGLGHSAWGKAIGKRCEVDGDKVPKLIRQIAKEAGFELTQDQWTDVKNLVSGAMQWGLVPSKYPQKSLVPDDADTWESLADDRFVSDYSPALADLARSVLIESIKLSYAGVISYDDQIYMSAMFGGVFPKYPLVLTDESQDMSPLNHIQIRKTAMDRLIVVGDPKQAIYAFRGADSESMSKLRDLRKEWIDLPLRTTFRCPKAVVERQQPHAPGFRAAETNAEGRVLNWREKPEGEAHWNWESVERALTEIGPSARPAILSRNNAQILSMAFKLIRKGIGVVVLGRDIGKGLIALSKKLMPDDALSAEGCAEAIRSWFEREVRLARANGKEGKVAGLEDRAASLEAVLMSGECRNAGELRSAIERLFARDVGKVTLATGHRSKGLEWDLVLFLDPWRIPSKFAQRALMDGDPRQMNQEMNLRYVIETRTKHTLILANLEDYDGESE